MPLTSLLEERIVHAENSTDRNLPYKCKFCPSPMILKRGEIKIPHFAHKVSEECVNRKPESEMHLRMKEYIRSKLPGAELEVRVGNTIFDVAWQGRFFECQASPLALDEYYQREECAYKNNSFITWILAVPPFGKTFYSDFRIEYTKLRALELKIAGDGTQHCRWLRYLEWHVRSERMIFYERCLKERKINRSNYGDDDCSTIWTFDEAPEKEVDFKASIL